MLHAFFLPLFFLFLFFCVFLRHALSATTVSVFVWEGCDLRCVVLCIRVFPASSRSLLPLSAEGKKQLSPSTLFAQPIGSMDEWGRRWNPFRARFFQCFSVTDRRRTRQMPPTVLAVSWKNKRVDMEDGESPQASGKAFTGKVIVAAENS